VAPTRPEITGLLLAGGRGSRMGGVDKGWVLFDGRPLVRHVFDRFVPQVGSLLISANRSLDDYRQLAEVVTDEHADLPLEAFAGPLAGLLAGMNRARTDWIALAPCDAPALPTDLVARLAEYIGEASVAFPVAGGRTQPAFALVRCSARASLRAFLQAGGRAMHRWYDTVSAVAVGFDDLGAFRNINQPGVETSSIPPTAP
jgi:molybdopterin-guanine dinucleotide biosynthesis protein A